MAMTEHDFNPIAQHARRNDDPTAPEVLFTTPQDETFDRRRQRRRLLIVAGGILVAMLVAMRLV